MRWMRQVPRERLFVVEVNDDCEMHIALAKPQVWAKRNATDLRDAVCITGEVLRECVYCRLVRPVVPRQEVHVA